MNLKQQLELFTNKRFVVILLLGFSSGLPFALVGSTLQAWFAKENLNLSTIGFVGLTGLPYAFKFLWAPLMDRYTPPWFGRRRGWMLITQLALFIGIATLGLFNPQQDLAMMILLTFIVTFFSASQDIAINAYTTDLLAAPERGLGAAATVGGYNIAMRFVSGAIALILAAVLGWHITYFIMALLMLVGMITSLIAPDISEVSKPPMKLQEAFIDPWKDFLKREKAILLMLFILIYKIGDAFANSLITTFLLTGAHFTLIEVGTINKTITFAATTIGVFCGGFILSRLRLFSGLLIFGFLQAVSNLMFMWLALIGKNYFLMASSVAVENFCGGLATAAFTAFIMSLCNKKYTATQYALLSALFSLTRTLISPIAGEIAQNLGWVDFFLFTFLVSLPGLLLLLVLRQRISYSNPTTAYS